jgi:hypothetical protein
VADNPQIELLFGGECPDCGQRVVELPQALPSVGDDFDWNIRDFESFRRFMLEELAARFSERKRWTPADVEVALAEVLAMVLDQLSDTLDRVAAEAYLDTARRPESVRRLLGLIGYDALGLAKRRGDAPFDQPAAPADTRGDAERFDQYWLDHPAKMDMARLQGPRSIHTQKRMVTLEDYVTRLEEHPLVLRGHAWTEWGGSWIVVYAAVVNWQRHALDEEDLEFPDELWEEVEDFHEERNIALPDRASKPTLRGILNPYLEAYRLCGQEVVLRDAREVGILLSLSVQVNANYFQSEVRRALEQALGTGPGGFFDPGRLAFGEVLHAGDIFLVLMALDGVDNVCLNRFKRIGDRFPDESDSGRIVLEGLEVAICDNDSAHRERGYYKLKLNGGRKG